MRREAGVIEIMVVVIDLMNKGSKLESSEMEGKIN